MSTKNRVTQSPVSPFSMSPLLPTSPQPPSPTGNVVNVDELVDHLVQYHRQKRGLSVGRMILCVVISDIIILGLLVGLYYILYSQAPGAIIPNAGLSDLYLTDLNVADFTINATTIASLRTDLEFRLLSNTGFNISSRQGTDIVFSTHSGSFGTFPSNNIDTTSALSSTREGRVIINDQFVFTDSTLTVTNSSGLTILSPSTLTLSSSSLQLDAPSLVFSGGSLSVQGAVTASSLHLTGALTAGSLSVGGTLRGATVSASGAITAASVSASSLQTTTLTASSLTSPPATPLNIHGSNGVSLSSNSDIVLSAGSGKVSVSTPLVVSSTPIAATSADGLVINGPLRITETAVFPPCSEEYRGTLKPIFGADGQADSLLVCGKNSSDIYSYQPLSYSTAISSFVTDVVVASGESISAGDAVSFSAGRLVKGAGPVLGSAVQYAAASVTDSHTAALSSTLVVVAYGSSTEGRAVIATVNPATQAISAIGTSVQFAAGGTTGIMVVALSDTSFVVLYQLTGTVTGYGVVGTVSGTTITLGTPVIFTSATNPQFIEATKISTTQFVVVYRMSFCCTPGNNWGSANVGTVSGTTLTFGPQNQFNQGFTKDTTVTLIAPMTIILTYMSNAGHTAIATVSGNTLTIGSTAVFTSASGDSLRVAAVSSSQFIIAWAGAAQRGTMVAGSVSGLTFTFSYPVEFNSYGGTGDIDIVTFSNNTFMLAYESTLSFKTGYLQVGQVVGTGGVVIGPPYQIGSDIVGLGATQITPDSFAVSFAYGTTGRGMVLCGTRKGAIRFFGVAQSSGSSGQKVSIAYAGLSSAHGNLTPGVMYYASAAGEITSSYTRSRIGLAISATDMLLMLDTTLG